MGTAITKAPAVHIRVLTIMDRRPYSAFSGEVGSQVLLPRNSAREISLKAGTAVYTKMAKLPMRLETHKADVLQRPFVGHFIIAPLIETQPFGNPLSDDRRTGRSLPTVAAQLLPGSSRSP